VVILTTTGAKTGKHPQEPGDADQAGGYLRRRCVQRGCHQPPVVVPQISSPTRRCRCRTARRSTGLARAGKPTARTRRTGGASPKRFWSHFPEYRASAGGRDIPVILLEPTETSDGQNAFWKQDGEG